jgi:LuxR family transcriptional regulator, maltose regulon positive regulatory protein
MPRPGRLSRDEAVAHARDDLLATKLNLPRQRPDHLGRPRLMQRLNDEMIRDLIVVCTPAGFGETTMLADWAASAHWPVGWVSLDSDDNDPVRFWRHVLVALDRPCGGLVEPVLPLLSPPSVVSCRGVVTALINELEAAPDELALVLDDYHLITSRPIHDDMVFLLSHIPRRLRVVIASRTDPPFALCRLPRAWDHPERVSATVMGPPGCQ